MARYMNFEYDMFNQCAINNQFVVNVKCPPSNLMFGSGSSVGNGGPPGENRDGPLVSKCK